MRPAEVRLQDLADVHAGRHADRVEDDVDRRAVRQERHVLDRQDRAITPLLPWRPAILSPSAIFRFWAMLTRTSWLTPAGSSSPVVAAELLDVDHLAVLAVRHAQRGVLHLARLLAEDRAQQALLGGQLGLALRRDLADQDVARRDLGADRMIPFSSRLRRLSSPTFGMSRVISSGPSLVSRASISCFSMWIEVNMSSRTSRSLMQDRVLEVAALPGHERDQDVLAQRQLALVGAGAVGEDLALRHPVAHVDDRALVDAGALVRAHELLQRVGVALVALVALDHRSRRW